MIRRHKTIQAKRKARVTNKVKATLSRPRLVVKRSNKHIYVQVIDLNGAVVASSSDKSLDSVDKKLTKSEVAALVGSDIAAKAKKAKVSQVTFDRGHYKYLGRVKSLAEAARSAGMEF